MLLFHISRANFHEIWELFWGKIYYRAKLKNHTSSGTLSLSPRKSISMSGCYLMMVGNYEVQWCFDVCCDDAVPNFVIFVN